MLPFLFPVWGPSAPDVAVPAPIAAPRWGTVSPKAMAWGAASRAPRRTPRFEELYAQTPVAATRNVDFVYRVQTQFPFVIATSNAVYIKSHISVP